MKSTSIIQIFIQNTWVNAAEIIDLGNGKCRFDYCSDYIYGNHLLPVSLAMPVGFYDVQYLPTEGGAPETLDHRIPPFLYDLVPQGAGRKFLSNRLHLADSDGVELTLLKAGAFNPIGALRINTAVEFYTQLSSQVSGGQYDFSRGVELQEIQLKSEKFLYELSVHGMLASGTTGVQGAAPKYLLSKDKKGLWHPDMGLPDEEVLEHWLLKLPRGRSHDDLLVLRNEAAYLRVAKVCGIRVYAEPIFVNDMLFVRRFDRVVTDDAVNRLHQESLASLAGHRGFGIKTSHNELLMAMRQYVNHPLQETVEYLKRDALNQALRNTDNHARNTAVQRNLDGTVSLTPLFDFAPMYKDPEMIPRAVHWKDQQGNVKTDWLDIFNTLELPQYELEYCAKEMLAFADVISNLHEVCLNCGVDKSVVDQCSLSINKVANSLYTLADFNRV